MDSWFDLHSCIVGYLNAFHYAVSTEGDHRLRDQYQYYIASESCKLARTSKLRGEKRISGLSRQAVAIQKELDGFKRLSDERRRERETKDRNRMRFLCPRAYGDCGGPCDCCPQERRIKRQH